MTFHTRTLQPNTMAVSSAIVWYAKCLDYLNLALWVRFHGRCWYQSFIDGSNIWGADRTAPYGPAIDHPPLGRSYLVEMPSYDMCINFLNRILWVRFHGWSWYQSFIDGSNIWGVDGTDPWDPEMDRPPLDHSYLLVVPSYDMPSALIILTWLYGWDSTADVDMNPSSMGPLFGVWLGPTPGVPKWTIHYWAATIW